MISDKQRADARSAVVKTYHEHLGGPPVPISYLYACADAAIEALQNDAPAYQVKSNGSDWLKHDGKTMPVNGSTRVEVRLANGVEYEPDFAQNWLARSGSKSNWHHEAGTKHPCDIIEYRIVTPALSAVAAPGIEDALPAAYKAGFEAAGQGYNGEIFPEFETDGDWLAKRNQAIAQIQNVGRKSDGRKDVGKKSDETETKAKNSTKSIC